MRIWILAIAITLGAALYQRITGPTFPVLGHTRIGTHNVHYRLARSHGGPGDQTITIKAPDTRLGGELLWRLYPGDDPFTRAPMRRQGLYLQGDLPHQPVAGKIEYKILLTDGTQAAEIPPGRTIVTRFKGAVPLWILILHIITMSLGMLFANRAGLEALQKQPNLLPPSRYSLALLTIGGLVLGPIVQKYAFDYYWSGVPFGWDLTDNKTLIASVAWLPAVFLIRKRSQRRVAVLAAAILTLVVFLIPHSLFGSELKR